MRCMPLQAAMEVLRDLPRSSVIPKACASYGMIGVIPAMATQGPVSGRLPTKQHWSNSRAQATDKRLAI